MQFRIYQESRKGARRENQDRIAYCYSRDALLMIVADGLGGHLHGEVAARIVVQVLSNAFRREARPRLADPARFLREQFLDAHVTIEKFTNVHRLAESPLTTCVACIVQDGAACWGHAGDSRLYFIRGGRMLARTQDHSRVQQLVEQGRIREESIAVHPFRNRITNCLGSVLPPRVELSEKTALEPGDSILLCSDGFWSPLSSARIAAVLLRRGITEAMPELLDLAELHGGIECDNLSVVAMTWEAGAASTGSGEITTQTLEPDRVETEIEQTQTGPGGWGRGTINDHEIERTVAAIQRELRRHSSE